MKVTLITKEPSAPCSMFYSKALTKDVRVSFQNFDIENHDVVLLMTYDHEILPQLKKAYPNKIFGLIDPRNKSVIDSAKHADFLIVDSIEMEDYWRIAEKPIFRYAEYPDLNYVDIKKKHNDKIKIGYHGNKVHLECMRETVTPALKKLANEIDVELVILSGQANYSSIDCRCLPINVDVKFINWSIENYYNELSKCDIGIVPNNLLLEKNSLLTTVPNDTNDSHVKHKMNYSDDDYLIRFKMPSNPGRIIVFGILGVPVISDFFPSALQCIDENNGLLANSSDSWYYNMKLLAADEDLRIKLAKNMQNLVKNKFDFNYQNSLFFRFLDKHFCKNT